MPIIEINDKEKWNEFATRQEFSQFLQSWEWGEFHKKMGRKVWRVFIYEDVKTSPDPSLLKRGTIGIASQIIKYDLPFGQSYLYSSRGPLVSLKLKVESKKFFDWVKELAQKEGSIFFRFEPMEKIKGNCKKVKSIQPEREWILDLEKSEEDLLKGMHQKTRYNIRLAEKKGVKINRGKTDENFEKFWKLIKATYNKKDIRTQTKEYYKRMLEIEGVELWLAEYENKIIVANIISYFGDTASYMHGGADYEYRNLMAPYLLQWEAIKNTKAMAHKYYNFGGVSDTKESWQGITKFKKGFGGFEKNYAGTFDLPIRQIGYSIYTIARKIR